MRSEYFTGNGVSDWKNREMWEADGAQDTWQRAGQMVKDMLARKGKSYIPEDADQAIRRKFKIML
jgi:trimethylamine--corrinoid protein Co-methyltransferase